MSKDHDLLIEALKRLASGSQSPEDLQELQKARNSGRITIASNGSVAIGGDVSGSIVAGSLVLPPEVFKLLRPAYQPPPLDRPDVLADRGDLPPGHRLPISTNAVFTGRQEDLLNIAQGLLYAQGRSRSDGLNQGIVVTGMGGLGKTQLAVEFCYRYGRFFRGVHWLQANLDIQAEIAENGGAMDLPYWPDKLPEQVQVTLRTWQDSGRRLIVLDSAENLQVLQDWLPRLRPASLLITSRRESWPVDLGLKVMNLEVLARARSIELLGKLAPQRKSVPDGPLNNLAGYLGDLPLALDLAGRYLADRPELSIEGYLEELHKAGSESVLEHTSLKDWVEHSPTKHPTSLVATFTLSWQQLTEGDEIAKRLFRIAGYCAPNTPIPRQLLAKTSGTDVPGHELDRALRKLDSLGLTNLAAGGRRVHSLLAEFARLKDRDADKSVLPALADAMTEITTQAFESGMPENMSPLREHLDAVARAAEKTSLQATGAMWNNLGMFLQVLADYDGARKLLEKALEIDEKVYGKDHPNVAIRINNLGLALKDLGELEEAKKCFERALQIGEKVYGPDNPTVATMGNNLGSVLQDLGDLQEAKECVERALKILRNKLGDNHPNTRIVANNWSSVSQDRI